MAGIDVAVDVGLDHAVHGQAAERRITSGWLLISAAQDDLVLVGDVRAQLGDAVFAEEKAVAEAMVMVPERSNCSMPSWTTSV